MITCQKLSVNNQKSCYTKAYSGPGWFWCNGRLCFCLCFPSLYP